MISGIFSRDSRTAFWTSTTSLRHDEVHHPAHLAGPDLRDVEAVAAPSEMQLADLLLERHLPQQRVDALLDRGRVPAGLPADRLLRQGSRSKTQDEQRSGEPQNHGSGLASWRSGRAALQDRPAWLNRCVAAAADPGRPDAETMTADAPGFCRGAGYFQGAMRRCHEHGCLPQSSMRPSASRLSCGGEENHGPAPDHRRPAFAGQAPRPAHVLRLRRFRRLDRRHLPRQRDGFRHDQAAPARRRRHHRPHPRLDHDRPAGRHAGRARADRADRHAARRWRDPRRAGRRQGRRALHALDDEHLLDRGRREPHRLALLVPALCDEGSRLHRTG